MSSLKNLNKHKKNMHNPVPVVCPFCSKIFPNAASLQKHKVTEHRPLKECQYCEYKTAFTNMLNSHMAKHSEAQFQCGYCEKKLKSKKSLTVHERDHTGERPFTFEVCGKGFKSSTVLIVHKQGVHKIFGSKAKYTEPRKRIRSKRKI